MIDPDRLLAISLRLKAASDPESWRHDQDGLVVAQIGEDLVVVPGDEIAPELTAGATLRFVTEAGRDIAYLLECCREQAEVGDTPSRQNVRVRSA